MPFNIATQQQVDGNEFPFSLASEERMLLGMDYKQIYH